MVRQEESTNEATTQVQYEVNPEVETSTEAVTEEPTTVPETESETETEPETETVPAPEFALTPEEIDLIALVTMAEAEGESEYGKRLVIDTILNRVESPHFDNTVHGVIYAPGQFSPMWNGRIEKCYVREDIRQLVIEEANSRTNRDVIYFRMYYYCQWGDPLFQVGGHYFSSFRK